MDATLAIILKAQDQMSAIFKQATDAAKGLESGNKAAGAAMEGASQSADDMAQSTEGAAVSNAALRAILEKVAESSGQSAASLKKLEAGLDATKKETDQASKSSESLATKLHSIISVAAFAAQAVAGGARLISESLSRAAEDGNDAAKSIVGQFKSMEDSADSITGAIAESMAPAFQPLTKAINSGTKAVADWARANEIGKKIVIGTLEVLLAFSETAIAAREALVSFVDKVNLIKPISEAIGEYTKKMFENSQAGKQLAGRNQELANTLAELDKWNSQAPKSAEEWREELSKGSVQAEDTTNRLEALRDTIAKLIKDSENSKDLDFSFVNAGESSAGANKAQKDDLEKNISEMGELLQKGLDQYYEQRERAQDDTHELYSEGLEEELEAWAAFGDSKKELVQAFLDDSLAAIELESATEEEASKKRIALYQEVAQSAMATAEQRKAAEKSAAQESMKLAAMMADKWKQTSHASASAFGTMIDTMLKGGTTLKDKLKTVFTQISDMVLANLQKQQDAAISAAEKSVAAGEAASVREALAAQKGIIPKILSATASLGWPAGPIAAGLMIAAFNALSKKVISFFEEGGVVGGMVQGFGRKDSVVNAVMPGEGVINRTSTESIGGKQTIDYINKTGQLPSQGGNGGSRVVHVHLDLNVRGGLLLPQQLSKEIGTTLIDVINHAVLNDGASLYATDAAI